MLTRGMICLLAFCQIASGNHETFPRNSFFLKLVNFTLPGNHGGGGAVAARRGNDRCEPKFATANDSVAKFLGRAQARLAGDGGNSSGGSGEMEPPAAKFSIFNLLSDEEEEEENDDKEDDGKVKHEEEEEEEEEDDDIDFFGPEEETSSDKPEGMKDDGFLKQYHRHGLRVHNLVFPLLLAYKLKFFTVIPLLLGALVLLVGTTGIAGFFFALFAAALGIRVKSHDE